MDPRQSRGRGQSNRGLAEIVASAASGREDFCLVGRLVACRTYTAVRYSTNALVSSDVTLLLSQDTDRSAQWPDFRIS